MRIVENGIEYYVFKENIGTEENPVMLTHRFNYTHYRMCYSLRDRDPTNGEIKNHPAVGSAFIDNEGKICIIEKVCKHWHFGFYEHAVYRVHNTLSHGSIYIKNLSCLDEIVQNTIARFSKYVKLTKEEIPPEEFDIDEENEKMANEARRMLNELTK